MFLVKWNDLSEKVVYRRFTEIYEFHVSPPGTHGLGVGRKEGECQITSKQTWFKGGCWVQCFNLFCPLKVGAMASVSLGTEVWDPASTCQWQQGEHQDRSQAGGRGGGVPVFPWCHPHCCAWLCSAESAEGDVPH